MSPKAFFCVFFITAFLQTHAQKTVRVEGVCKIRIETNMSKDQAQNEALACAKKKALEDAFGTKIIQTDILKSQSKNESEKITSSSSYNSIGNIEVNGEWVETDKQTFQKFVATNGDEFIECTISGKARPLKKIAINFESFPTTNEGDKQSRSFSFNNNQNLYFYFKSAKSGFLSIYLDDNKNTYQLLPYKNSNIENYPVELDKEYYFFSKNNTNGFSDKSAVSGRIDELQVSTDEAVEINTMHVIFSPKKYDKPLLNNDNATLSDADKQKGFQLPKYIPSVKFIEYLQKLRKSNDEIEIQSIPITINGK